MTKKSTQTTSQTNLSDSGPQPSAAPSNDGGDGNGNGGGGSTALALAPHDDLATLGLDEGAIADDGLSEANQDDMRIPVYTLNFPGTNKAGRPIAADVFYNTVDEVELMTVDAVFISLHKTNMYAVRDKATKKRRIVCSSYDQLQGNMDGVIRPCAGCPDAQWRTEKDDNGQDRKTRSCDEIYNVYSGNRATMQPFIIRFKRTALKPFKAYLQKHHLKRRLLPGGVRKNYPLYVFSVTLSGKMAGEGQKHAVPILERGELLTRDEVLIHAQSAQEIGSHWRRILTRVEEQAERAESTEDGDASFDTSKYADAAGADFVPAQGE